MTQQSHTDISKKLWTKDFVVNLLTAHFLFASYTSLFTIIPQYVLDRGGQEWHIGIVIGSFGIAGIIFRPFGGRWIYKYGAKRLAFTGALLLGIGSMLYDPASNVWLILPVRALQGIGLALAPVATTTMVANLAPTHRRGEAMGYMGNAIAVSTIYAPLASFWLLTHLNFQASFLFSAATAFLSAALALQISAHNTALEVDTPGDSGDEKIPLVSKRALFPTLVFLSYTFTTAPLNMFLPLLAQDRGLGNPGLYYTVYSATTMFVLLGSGSIADRFGRPAVIAPGLLMSAVAMFLLMVASNQIMFLAAGFLAGVGFGLLQPGTQSLTVDRVPARERGAALATLQQAWDIGGSGGAFLIGPIAGVIGIAATFGIASVSAVTGTVGFLIGNARSPAVLPTAQKPDTVGDD